MEITHTGFLLSSLSWPIIASSFVLYLITIALYRLIFHPLAGFPGPKLAAVTRWFEGYYDVVQDGQYTLKIAQLHQIYGPIVRISPHELHISDPTFFNTLYCQEGRWDKYAWAWDAFAAEGPTVHTVEHSRHRARRQPLATYFSKPRVANKQSMISKHVDALCDVLSSIAEREPSHTVDLGAAVTALAHDVGFDFILGKHYSSVESQDFNVSIQHATQGAGPLWRLTKHVGLVFPILNSIPLDWAMKISDDNMKHFFSHVKVTMSDTKELLASVAQDSTDSGARHTIVHEIVASKLPPSDKTFQRLFEEVTSVSGAGFETVGAVLRLICFHVFSNAEILRRLRTEVDDAQTKNSGVMTVKVLEQLPYLTSTIMEGLRLSPGLATRMARIAPDRDLYYRDFRIPAGTPVGMTTVLMHMDEKLYPDPKLFQPERWFDGDDTLKTVEKGFAPFSRGTRMCIGMHLAWSEMYLAIAALVQKFDITFPTAKAEDFECISDQFTIGTRGKGSLEAVVKFRK